MAVAKKKKKKWYPVSLVSSALRRIWAWSPLRREALAIAGHACEECGAKGKEVKLEVHHRDPVDLTKESKRICEKLFPHVETLDVLCHSCHQEIHRKETII